jgi:hypothetical protein
MATLQIIGFKVADRCMTDKPQSFYTLNSKSKIILPLLVENSLFLFVFPFYTSLFLSHFKQGFYNFINEINLKYLLIALIYSALH